MISSAENHKGKEKGRRSLAQRPRSPAALVAGILTIFTLGIVWTVVLHNLPTQNDVPAVDPSQSPLPAPHTAPSSSAADPPPPPPSASPSPPPSTMPFESAPNPTLSPPPPIAQEPRARRELERNCLVVLEKLCQDIPPGGGRRRKCFQDNVGNLSPACQVKLQAQAFQVREGTQQLKAACESDARRLCPQAPLAGGRILQCLEDHSNELSDSCYQALEDRPLRR
ncbi:MAG: cysteine rich repeat-containing protein [Nitrospiraceae bacterium]